MAITIHTFPWLLTYGTETYRARACGSPQKPDGLWEGWIEFDPADGGSNTLRSARETTQPNLTDLEYWSTGLTAIYLEGVLNRVMNPAVAARPAVVPPAVFDGPAPRTSVRSVPPPPVVDAVLDPYSAYTRSPHVLTQELRALSNWHLRRIVRAYALADERDPTLETMSHQELADLIMRTVSERARSHSDLLK